jgi:hypothetical protein
LLAVGGNPRNKVHAIETHQTGRRADPKISIGGLRNHYWNVAENSILDSPGGVAILGDLTVWIQRAGCNAEKHTTHASRDATPNSVLQKRLRPDESTVHAEVYHPVRRLSATQIVVFVHGPKEALQKTSIP